MPLYDQSGNKLLSNEDIQGIGQALLDHPLPMRWTHAIMERLHKAMSLPETQQAPAGPRPPTEPPPPEPTELPQA